MMGIWERFPLDDACRRHPVMTVPPRTSPGQMLVQRGPGPEKVGKKLGTAEYRYCRWRKEYGGLRLTQARRLKELERENVRLKKLVADLSLDNAILREAAQGNSSAR